MNKDIQFELTSSNYVNKKYTEFYKKHGYIPKMFNPYNCSEITDIAPTITTQCRRIRSFFGKSESKSLKKSQQLRE